MEIYVLEHVTRKWRVLLVVLVTLFLGSVPAMANPEHAVSRVKFDSWMQEISNWGRWGANDELGTLNLITPELRIAAAGLVESGHAVSMALDLNKVSSPLNTNPFQHSLEVGAFGGHQVAGDRYSVEYHGFSHSHVDGLAHFAHKGKMYNGVSVDVLKAEGATKLGIHNAKEGIITRGVLVDMPWLHGVDWLEPGTVLTKWDFEKWEQKTGIKVRSGDVLLVRTGRWQRLKDEGEWNFLEAAAGSHASVALWLKERDVAVIGSDGVSDVMPSHVEGLANPLHELVLVGLGMPILDNLDLDAVTEAAKRHKRWTFMFVGAPLRVPGGTGSPLNPIAVF